ncbi:oxidoreductase [Agaricicola taiwanensis]|uniref:Oxidoreductase n=1 Tax=Agaricicola taiwanensis TaxID=591372 RepID=A0A8J2VWH8_9RHOB|nr:SDR family oxidoreductase [Agaricicola taiwanensis]GGE39743.1 oxidoreductase [Agaricicola taiwanensis]
MNISGNTILITGGNSGIGQGLAEAFHKAGNKVIIAGRRREALEAITAAHRGMSADVLDVDDAEAIKTFAAKVIAEHPSLNVVINNAGIMRDEDLLADPLDLSDAEAIITTNLLGPIRLTAALLPHLRRQPKATVMTVSSGLAFVPLTRTPTYNATKAAIHSWSQSLRHQLKDTNVEVVELAPPAVATPLQPGHDTNPNSMPLADYIAEVMALIETQPNAEEILVERVKFLRFAEARGDYDQVFSLLNQLH